jgi:hypothetical protein
MDSQAFHNLLQPLLVGQSWHTELHWPIKIDSEFPIFELAFHSGCILPVSAR